MSHLSPGSGRKGKKKHLAETCFQTYVTPCPGVGPKWNETCFPILKNMVDQLINCTKGVHKCWSSVILSIPYHTAGQCCTVPLCDESHPLLSLPQSPFPSVSNGSIHPLCVSAAQILFGPCLYEPSLSLVGFLNRTRPLPLVWAQHASIFSFSLML